MSDVTFKLNEGSLVRAIEEHRRTFRKSYEQLFLIAAKGIAAKAVRLTPPFKFTKGSADTESDKAARARGIKAVEIGVGKVFTTSKDVAQQNGFSGDLSRKTIQQNSVFSMMRQQHKQNRNNSGRVPKNHAPTYVVTKSGLRKYVSKIKKNVGYLASGWVQGAKKVQASIPSWIKKHSGSGSSVLQITENKLLFKMTNAVNFDSKFGLMASRISVAVRLQTAAMLKQIVFKTKKRVNL